jgi:PAS domain S-box-containing protein
MNYTEKSSDELLQELHGLIKENEYLKSEYQKDISYRINAEKSLKISEEFNRRIVETANEGIWVIDKNQMSTFVNQKMADLLGFSIEEIVGRPISDFVFEADMQFHISQMEARKAGEANKYERRFKRKDGSGLWTLVST